MLNKKHKLLELRTSALVDSLFIGNYKTKHKGRGIEFVDYKEYDFSDDVKNIDFLRSEKEGKTLVKLFEEERDLSIYFILDIDKTFFSELLNIRKIDIVFELLYLIGLSAIKQGDKIGSFILNTNNKKINFAKKGKQNFINIIQDVENFPSNNKNINNKNAELKYFNSLKIKNSLVFLITDNLDTDSKDLKILGIKNDLIVCNIFNSFENNLNSEGIIGFNKGDVSITLDLDDKMKVNEYINLRKDKISNMKNKVIKSGGKYLLLDETKNIYSEVAKLFGK
ncbi:MAG: DUF58 domain-containing protein [Candidatus Gracilibacteria bacterium]